MMVSEYGGATAYSLFKEREADKAGLYLMAQAGSAFGKNIYTRKTQKSITDKADTLLSIP